MTRNDHQFDKVLDYMNGHKGNQLQGCEKESFWISRGYTARQLFQSEVTLVLWHELRKRISWVAGWNIWGNTVESAYRVDGYTGYVADKVAIYIVRKVPLVGVVVDNRA